MTGSTMTVADATIIVARVAIIVTIVTIIVAAAMVVLSDPVHHDGRHIVWKLRSLKCVGCHPLFCL